MTSIASLSKKGAWISPSIRSILVSTRPWSIPASLVPAALAGAIEFDSQRDNAILNAILPIVAGMAAHFAANTTNTIFDYRKGLDRKDTSDDRALVDGRVSVGLLASISLGCYLVALSICGWYAYLLGPAVAGVSALGLLLAFFYTADPFSLKYHGFGDVVIFLCFGPVLMGCTAAAVTQTADEIHWASMYLSVPIGLLTVAILHANNTRDVKADAAAGARTVAQIVGFRWSYVLYVLYFVAAYIGTAFTLAFWLASNTMLLVPSSSSSTSPSGNEESNSITTDFAVPATIYDIVQVFSSASLEQIFQAVFTTPSPSTSTTGGKERNAALLLTAAAQLARGVIMLVIITLPWCLALIRRFSKRALATLPQATAQFNLLFGACVFCALLPFDALARLLLGVLFYLGGVNNLLMWHHTKLLVHQKLTTNVSSVPQWFSSLSALGATCMQLGASVLFILGGMYARESAIVLVLFLLPVTGTVHDMWNTDYDEVSELNNVPEGVRENYSSSSTIFGSETVDDSLKSSTSPSSSSKGISRGRAGSSAGLSASNSSSSSSSSSKTSAVKSTPSEVRKRRTSQGATSSSSSSSSAAAVGPEQQQKQPFTGEVPTFLTEFDNQFVHYFKNVGMLGGLLVYLAYAPKQQ